MRFKSVLSVLLIGSSSFYTAQALAGPSSALTTICSNAFGTVEQESAPTTYVESLTLQDMEAKVVFADGSSYDIWPNNYSSAQNGQSDQVRWLVRYAYLHTIPINICTGVGAIWAVELDKVKRHGESSLIQSDQEQ